MTLRIAMAAFAAADLPAGYGVIGGKLHDALATAGAQILLPTEPGWDCVLAISLPAMWLFPGSLPRQDMVFHTMFETEPLPADWVPVLNNCGAVWTPSAWCSELFADAGVRVPILTAGYGIDPSVYFARRRTVQARPFRFVIFGTGLVGRKNVLMGIRAFLAAGLPPTEAELIIKVNRGMSATYVQNAAGEHVPNVKIIAEDWQYQSQLAELFLDCDCGISLSGGEGFGLMPLEMAATGLPLICADNTGMHDYLTENVMRVPTAGRIRSPEYEARFGGSHRWLCQPSFDATVDYIRQAFANRTALYEMGWAMAEDIHTRWTWAHAGRRALSELQRIY